VKKLTENQILFFKVGELPVPSAEIYYMQKFDTWETINFYVFYLNVNGKRILINTGVPSNPKNLTKFWEQWDKRCKFVKYLSMQEILNQLGLSPNDIDYVFVTPLVGYSTGNLDLFNRSKILFYRGGWVDFWAPNLKRGSFSDLPLEIVMEKNVLCKLVTEQRNNIVLLGDEKINELNAEIKFGGVHHRSSMIIIFNINGKKIAFTDSIFSLGNYDARTPIGILESIDEAYEVFNKLDKVDVVVPIFDRKLGDRFPNGVIKL
jgi:glyoxylase-like metal-dependent hydrolase (beta-lactamase superfamily II)